MVTRFEFYLHGEVLLIKRRQKVFDLGMSLGAQGIVKRFYVLYVYPEQDVMHLLPSEFPGIYQLDNFVLAGWLVACAPIKGGVEYQKEWFFSAPYSSRSAWRYLNCLARVFIYDPARTIRGSEYEQGALEI